MATPQQGSGEQQQHGKDGSTVAPPDRLPAPGSLPQMPDSVVNYENKNVHLPGTVSTPPGPHRH